MKLMGNVMRWNATCDLKGCIMRRILNPMMTMFMRTHGKLWGVYVHERPREWISAHRPYARYCSIWQMFGMYLFVEQGCSLLSIVCLFISVGVVIRAVNGYLLSDVCVCRVVVLHDGSRAYNTWLSSWTIALSGPFIQHTACLLKNSPHLRYGMKKQNVQGNCRGKRMGKIGFNSCGLTRHGNVFCTYTNRQYEFGGRAVLWRVTCSCSTT